MFLLNRTMLALLITTFGILLPSLHIQAAQALVCYDCNDEACKTGVTEMTKKTTCPSDHPFCEEFEIKWKDGTTSFERRCANRERADELSDASCQEFVTGPADSSEFRACLCETDLCNGKLGEKEKELEKKNASIRIRSLGQLLLFCIIVSVSASWK